MNKKRSVVDLRSPEIFLQLRALHIHSRMASSTLIATSGQLSLSTLPSLARKFPTRKHSRCRLAFESKIRGSQLSGGPQARLNSKVKHRCWKLRAELPQEEVKSSGSSSNSKTVVEEKKKEEVVEEQQGEEPSANADSANEKRQEVEEPSANADLANEKRQVVDWKLDDEVKKLLSNPSIETLLKVEAKQTAQRLKELENQDSGNIFNKLFAAFWRNTLTREKERLEKAQETFKALDLDKLKSCFSYDTFFANDVRRFGDGGVFIGNLRRPLEEVKPKLEAKITQVAGREVDLWFLEETTPDGESKQVCVVQPKSEIDLQFNVMSLSNIYGYGTALLLGLTTLGTIALMSGFFLEPGATFDDYVARVLPLFGGFVTIIGTSEIATRLTASKYGVTLSPSFLIPSSWTGCLGVVNNYESLLPNKKALFDIAAVRITSAYAASAVLALLAFYIDGSFNGGDNALVIRPQFFLNNPLLSFIQYVIGPYTDELGNVLPQAVPGVGVPVDPLAFAGLLGIVVSSLNMLPCGRLEGGRITQALFGRKLASRLSFFTSLLLGFEGLSGSVVALVWAFVATFFRGGEELPARDEITPLGNERFFWGFALALVCVLSLFPNSAGTFPSPLYTPPFFRGDLL